MTSSVRGRSGWCRWPRAACPTSPAPTVTPPDFDYDRELLDTLRAGRGRSWRISAEELDKRGNIELRTWITLLGAVGDVRAEGHCYEPSWHHGNAVVEWPL